MEWKSRNTFSDHHLLCILRVRPGCRQTARSTIPFNSPVLLESFLFSYSIIQCFHPSVLPTTLTLFVCWPVVVLVYYGLTFRLAMPCSLVCSGNTDHLSVQTRST